MQQTFETWITPIMIGGLIIFMCFVTIQLAVGRGSPTT